MTRIEVFGTDHRAEIPSSWDEMTPTQVIEVFRILDKCSRAKEDMTAFKVRVLCRLMGIKPHNQAIYAIGPELQDKWNENFAMLCEKCLGFLVDKDGRFCFNSLRDPLTHIATPGLPALVGPGDLLSGLTFGEFRHASAAFTAFARSQSFIDIPECLAFLWRIEAGKPNKAGRRVRPLTEAAHEKDFHRVGQMPAYLHNLAITFFASCLEYLQKSKVDIDGELVDMRLLFEPSGGASKGLSFGWNDLLTEIARDGSLGTMDEVDAQPLYRIFGIMWHNYKDRKRYEQMSKTHKSN